MNGTVDTDSLKYTQSNGNYSLNYNYTPDDDGSNGNSQSGTTTLGVGKIGLDTPPDPDDLRIQQLAQGITADSQHSFGCIAQAYGVGAPATSAYQLGQPVAGTKRFVSPGSSLGTSPLSDFLSKAAPIKGRFPAPVGGPGTGIPFKMTKTGNLGRAAARWTPFVALAADAYATAQLWNCLGH